MSIATTYGAFLLGGLAAVCLSGILTAQTYIYFKLYPNDLRSLKCVVATLWIVDQFHTSFLCAGLWRDIITDYGDLTAVNRIPWTIAMTVACTAITTLIVHCFFAYRIYKFSKHNLFLVTPILVLNILRFGSATGTVTKMIDLGSFTSFREHSRWVATLGLSVSSGVDIIVTASLCYFLRVSRFESLTLKPVLDALFIYTFEAGSLTCLSTFVTLVFWLTMPDNLVFMGFHFLIEKLFANTLLITLNTRVQLRQSRSTIVADLPMSSIDFELHKGGSSGSSSSRRAIQHDVVTLASDVPFQSFVAPPPPRPHTAESQPDITHGITTI